MPTPLELWEACKEAAMDEYDACCDACVEEYAGSAAYAICMAKCANTLAQALLACGNQPPPPPPLSQTLMEWVDSLIDEFDMMGRRIANAIAGAKRWLDQHPEVVVVVGLVLVVAGVVLIVTSLGTGTGPVLAVAGALVAA